MENRRLPLLKQVERPLSEADRLRDPVCGMMVDPARAAGSLEHEGRTYYFCSRSCLGRFQGNPAAYLGTEAAAPPPRPPAPTGTVYTCPMHPEVVRDRPGACPICGMALEPRTPTLEEGENPELRDMARRFWVGLALT